MSLVERIAEAGYQEHRKWNAEGRGQESLNDWPTWDALTEFARTPWLRQAQAALEALGFSDYDETEMQAIAAEDITSLAYTHPTARDIDLLNAYLGAFMERAAIGETPDE